MNIVFYAVPEAVAQSIAEHYGFTLYRSAEAFESSIAEAAAAAAAATTPAAATSEVQPDAPADVSLPDMPDPECSALDEGVAVAADVADGQLVIPDDDAVAEPAADTAPAADTEAVSGDPSAVVPGVAGRILLLPRLDSEERQSEFVEWMERFSNRVDAVISGQSSTISTVYYASQPGKFFSVERRHSEDDCEDLCYELSRIIDALLGGGTAHEEI